MSKLTDAIDAAGEGELPALHSEGVLASEAAIAARAAEALRAGEGLAVALARALDTAESLAVVGFSAKTAEPFAVGPLPRAQALAAVRARLAGEPNDDASEPLWAGHRGHAVWLLPGALDSARVLLALRLAEAIDPARILANPAALIAVAERALGTPEALDDALAPEAVERLASEVIAREGATVPAPAISRSPAIVLFDGHGAALVAVATSLALPIGLVERAGRPFVLPLYPSTPAALIGLVHRAIDRDTTIAELFGASDGVRLDGGPTPESHAPEDRFVVLPPR